MEKRRQKCRGRELLQIVACGTPVQRESCALCRRRKIVSLGEATQVNGPGDSFLVAWIGLISVVFVAKRVFGDTNGAERCFGITSLAQTLCWRRVRHCVVLLSLCRSLRVTKRIRVARQSWLPRSVPPFTRRVAFESLTCPSRRLLLLRARRAGPINVPQNSFSPAAGRGAFESMFLDVV